MNKAKLKERVKQKADLGQVLSSSRVVLNDIYLLQRAIKKSRGSRWSSLIGASFFNPQKQLHTSGVRSSLSQLERSLTKHKLTLKNQAINNHRVFDLPVLLLAIDTFSNNFLTPVFIHRKINKLYSATLELQYEFKQSVLAMKKEEARLDKEIRLLRNSDGME